MKTGIVVLNYNDAIETIDFVEKISTFNAVDIICVVDNCSTDDSVKQLKKLKNIELIALDTNEGYAAGNNAGLKYLYEQECDNYIISNPQHAQHQEKQDDEELRNDTGNHVLL